jgi:hypothetical protein
MMPLLLFLVLVKVEQKKFNAHQKETMLKDLYQNTKNHKNHAN